MICIQCKKEFEKKRNTSGNFCSHRCYTNSLRKQITVKCLSCHKEFNMCPSRHKRSKNKVFFCSRKCKDREQSIGGNFQLEHYGSSIHSRCYRNRTLNNREKKCVGCGEKEEYLLQVHHIDGDIKNSLPNNLEIVCSNCHIKRHLKKINGKLKYDSGYLTPRDEVSIASEMFQ